MTRSKMRALPLLVVAFAAAVLALAAPAGAATWHFETLDGTGAPANGRVNGSVGFLNNAVLYGGQPHAFYYDGSHGTIRHAWWNGSAWTFETLDGPGSPYAGSAGHFVGNDANPAVVFGAQLHVFYFDQVAHTLRHAWWTGTTWAFEVLDGTGGKAAGQRNDNLGTDASVALFGGVPHVFYLDGQLGVLRHTWWNGASWTAETLDGQISTYPGHTPDSVGTYTAVILYGGQPHVFYRDYQVFSLRHAWWDGASWHFETIDGPGSSYAGHTGTGVGGHSSVVLYAGQLHVFNFDSTASTLRHAWWTGTTWAFDVLDGTGSTVPGQRNDVVGDFSSSVIYAGGPHVFYLDAQIGVLRHAWWNGVTWNDETLDGQTSPYPGATNHSVGSYTAVLLYGGQPHVFYYSPQDQVQRHAWYG